MHDIKYALYNSSKGFRVVGGTAAQFLKADGSVDSTSYLATGTDINMDNKNINFTTGSLSRFENSCRVFTNVYQRLLGTAQTGILSFKFPQASSLATMFEVTIKIFGWNARILGTIRVAFYKFTSTVLNSNHKAIIECSDNFPTTVINIGLDASGNICINVGEPTTVWNTYLKVEVERVAAFHQGANFDWSKGWSQTVETDVSTYTQLLPVATDVIATRTWVDQNNTGSIPKTPALLSTSDLNTILTPGFYYQHASSNATTARNYPILLAGYLNVYKASSTRIVQEYNDLQYGRIWKRVYDGTSFSGWLRVWLETDFTQININQWNNSVQQSALSNYYTKSEALNQFVGKNGVETISDTKTFTHSPVIPQGTLSGHAVNVKQLGDAFTGVVRVNLPFSESGLSLVDRYLNEEAGIYDPEFFGLLVAKESGLYKFGSKPGASGGLIVDPVNGHIGIGGVDPTASHNVYLNGSIRITGGIYSESISGDDIYAASGELYHLDKDVTQEDGSLRLSVYDRVFTGMSNTFDTDKRVIKITLIDGGTVTMQNYLRYQEITVMNVSGSGANFTIDNTPVNVSIPPKSSATFYVNSQNKIVLVRIDNDYCGILN